MFGFGRQTERELVVDLDPARRRELAAARRHRSSAGRPGEDATSEEPTWSGPHELPPVIRDEELDEVDEVDLLAADVDALVAEVSELVAETNAT